MNRLMFVCGVAVLLVAGCNAYPRGAPDSVCNDPAMLPSLHINTYNAQKNDTLQYTLTTEPAAENGVIKVTLSGPAFMGFVVRASTPQNEKNNGEFLKDPSASEFKLMNCARPEHVAVTHVHPNPKDSVTLFYADKNNGNYVFQATVANDLFNYVPNIVAQ